MVSPSEEEDILQLIEAGETYLEEGKYAQVEKVLEHISKILRWKG